QKPFWQLCEQQSALLPQPSPLALHPPLLLEVCGLPLALLLIPPAPEPLEDAACALPLCEPAVCALEPPDPALEPDGKTSPPPPQPGPEAASIVKPMAMSATTPERQAIRHFFLMSSS